MSDDRDRLVNEAVRLLNAEPGEFVDAALQLLAAFDRTTQLEIATQLLAAVKRGTPTNLGTNRSCLRIRLAALLLGFCAPRQSSCWRRSHPASLGPAPTSGRPPATVVVARHLPTGEIVAFLDGDNLLVPQFQFSRPASWSSRNQELRLRNWVAPVNISLMARSTTRGAFLVDCSERALGRNAH